MISEFQLQTVQAYSKSVKQKLLDMILDRGIATLEKQPTLLHEDVCLGDIPENIQLVQCLNLSPRAVKVHELYEYIKSYRYAIAMRVEDQLQDDKVAALTAAGKLLAFQEEDTDHFDRLGTTIEIPSDVMYYRSEDEYRFKLCFKIERYDPEGKQIKRKLAVLVVTHQDSDLIEIRYDSIPSHTGSNDRTYAECIRLAMIWIQNTLGLNVIDRDAPCERMHYIVTNRERLRAAGEVIISGQGMLFSDGSSAELFLGKSESETLPLIGELRQFLVDYEAAFQKAPELRSALEDFLAEKEQDSDWPWLLLRLAYQNKKIQLKYTTEHFGMNMCRIMFHDNTKYDAEAMSYAIKYVTENNSDHPAIEPADA